MLDFFFQKISKLITALKNGNLDQVTQLVDGSSRLLEQSYDNVSNFLLFSLENQNNENMS